MYKSAKGYFYKIINGKTTRIPARKIYKSIKKSVGGNQRRRRSCSKNRLNVKYPKVGQTVTISIKPYTGKIATGIIERVLTRKQFHSHGHKVMLSSGVVGRIK